MHHLKLHPWAVPDLASNPSSDPATVYAPPPSSSTDANGQPVPLLEPVHSWQYDEIVFTDPPKAFFDILQANPPTQLPRVKRRPAPPNPGHTASLERQPGGSSIPPEFTMVLERDEAERLDSARRSVVDAAEQQRALLMEKERELERLRKEVQQD